MSQAKEKLELAEIRLVRIRQERQEKFGHYDQLRRIATGVFQALDLGIIQSKMFRKISEELMVSIPKYWLAPALVALVAWVNDQKEIAERALAEALRRNEKRTSLFFALACRRYGRTVASNEWFQHYFRIQDPYSLDPEFTTLLEGITNGVFSLEIRQIFQETLSQWLQECSEEISLSDAERTAWRKMLETYTVNPTILEDRYHYVKEISYDWDKMIYSLQQHQYFTDIVQLVQSWLDQNDTPSPKIEDAVDHLIERLVMEADEEERNLKKEERKLEFIIECDGDWKLGEKKFLQEEVSYNQSRNLFQLIRSCVFDSTGKITPITRKYCLALSKNWIKEAHQDVTANIRYQVPEKIQFIRPGDSINWEPIDSWTYDVKDGSEELEVVRDFADCLKKSMKNMLKTYTRGSWSNIFELRMIKKVMGALAIVYIVDLILFSPMGILTIGAIWYGRKWYKERPFRKYKATYEEYATRKLKAAIADIVDWRRDLRLLDQKADDLPKLLEGLKAEEMLTTIYDKNRLVLK